MEDPVEPLILDLVEWVAKEPRRCADLLDVWRTSCPRLPVWEEAVARGLLTQRMAGREGAIVSVTGAGANLLRRHGRTPRQIVVRGR